MLAATTAGVGCGDDDEDGDGGNDGGAAGSGSSGTDLPDSLDRDTELAELSDSEAEDLCEALEDDVSASISEAEAERLSCTLLAAFQSLGEGGGTSVDREACEQAVQDCLDADLGEPMTETMCDASTVASAAEGCTTTVGEYFDCLQAGIDQLEEALDMIDCETLSESDDPSEMLGAGADLSQARECMAIQEECPDLLEDTGGSNLEPSESGCDDTCEFADDGTCDDGGEDSDFNLCGLGTDCTDCGER